MSEYWLELAEHRLFGAAKRIARTMGAVFVLNERGKERVIIEAERLAATPSSNTQEIEP